MKVLLALALPCLLVLASAARSDEGDLPLVAGLATVSGLASALSRADVALAASVVDPRHLKGAVAESVAGRVYLDHHLKTSGHWVALTSRFGRQGIDQLFMQHDTGGRPIALLVGEVKYGTSGLGETRDGRQMSTRWVENRLLALGQRYLSAATATSVATQQRPAFPPPRHQITVRLPGAGHGVFWREDAHHPWRYEGRPTDLEAAQRQVGSDGRFLAAGGKGEIDVRRRIFQVKPNGPSFVLRVQDASVPVTAHGRAVARTIELPLDLVKRTVLDEAATMVKFGLQGKTDVQVTDAEARRLAANIVKGHRPAELFSDLGGSFNRTMATRALKAGVVGGLLFPLLEAHQQYRDGIYDPVRLGETAAIGFAATGGGVSAGQLLTASLMRQQALAQAASRIGVGMPTLAHSLGGLAGMGVGGVILAYGGSAAGLYDLKTAHALAASGLIGAGGGALMGVATTSLAATFGTAGTGAAISSLSGVAATNASLAWLGGGTLASGGGGMAAGAMVVGGVVVIGAVAVTAAAILVWNIIDEKERAAWLKARLDFYRNPTEGAFDRYAEALFPVTD